MRASPIFVEEGEVLSHREFPGDQYRIRLRTPRCAATARPGSFVHLRCGSGLPQRRPLSVMLADAEEGWVELLYKAGGPGLTLLSQAEPGSTLHSMGPIGNGFSLSEERPIVLLLGGGVGIPPVLFLARKLAGNPAWQPRLFLGSELPYPFTLKGDGDENRLRCAEDWGVPSHLASNAGLPGCYRGNLTELTRECLSELQPERLGEVAVYACGPTPMLEAAAKLAADFDVYAELCLEEYMACAVGGCAGCTVEAHTPDGVAMKRVCVDGPVFPASWIYPPHGSNRKPLGREGILPSSEGGDAPAPGGLSPVHQRRTRRVEHLHGTTWERGLPALGGQDALPPSVFPARQRSGSRWEHS